MSVLNVPSPDDSFALCVDASVLSIGGVLCTLRNAEEVPVAFYSRQTKNAERSYSAKELEALALLCTIEHFSHYLCPEVKFLQMFKFRVFWLILVDRSVS